MPLTLQPLSRRQFLASSIAAAAAATTSPLRAFAPDADPNRFALLADTHIAGDPAKVLRGVNMFDHFQQAAKAMGQLDQLPSAVMVAGDCALTSGEAEDYATLVKLVRPLREAGLPVHFALGNHDHRQRFWDAFPRDEPPPIDQKHLTLLSTPRANWFLLDSLDKTNVTPGLLGDAQRNWLIEALEQASDKPALLVLHHNPDHRPKPSGLVDTRELLELASKQTNVKAVFFGHSHRWNVAQHEDVHLVNLPAVSYVFSKGMPSAWVDAQLTEDGAKLRLNSLQPDHPQHGETVELKWQA
jgi:3',5'-cyclic AMP phosphodiesterase CpdA